MPKATCLLKRSRLLTAIFLLTWLAVHALAVDTIDKAVPFLRDVPDRPSLLSRVTKANCGSLCDPQDPDFPEQWHLDHTLQSWANVDAHVRAAWDIGVAGRGVVICVVDDGVATAEPDFEGRFVSALNRNYSSSTNDPHAA
eukprot:gnl/Ergobibamus_cyprinoides/1868.p1 GENE.gnl/Ergobibamus_cyprinoides/1868~~gnl/Ergobibamus_cyprinoides/1868.p1  ORF type:complete len:141 (-),score=19.77 gnl/Ergobibamus_cyprinoides/1868:356-778(-)